MSLFLKKNNIIKIKFTQQKYSVGFVNAIRQFLHTESSRTIMYIDSLISNSTNVPIEVINNTIKFIPLLQHFNYDNLSASVDIVNDSATNKLFYASDIVFSDNQKHCALGSIRLIDMPPRSHLSFSIIFHTGFGRQHACFRPAIINYYHEDDNDDNSPLIVSIESKGGVSALDIFNSAIQNTKLKILNLISAVRDDNINKVKISQNSDFDKYGPVHIYNENTKIANLIRTEIIFNHPEDHVSVTGEQEHVLRNNILFKIHIKTNNIKSIKILLLDTLSSILSKIDHLLSIN